MSVMQSYSACASAMSSRVNDLLLKESKSPEVCLSIWDDFLKDQNPNAWISLSSALILKNEAGVEPCKDASVL
jgi:hypothetical protein